MEIFTAFFILLYQITGIVLRAAFPSFLADMIGSLAGLYKTVVCSKAVFLFLLKLVIFIIENVRSRLSKMCGADLEITIEKGKGTTAIIRIPKNKEQGE